MTEFNFQYPTLPSTDYFYFQPKKSDFEIYVDMLKRAKVDFFIARGRTDGEVRVVAMDYEPLNAEILDVYDAEHYFDLATGEFKGVGA
jgi:hypothetical protein